MTSLVKAAWLALLIGAAIISATLAWARIMQVDDPRAVLQIMPWHPGALLEAAEEARQLKRPPSEVAAFGRQILRMTPLLEAPLVYAGFDLAANGAEAEAHEAFTKAIDRQPRNVPALSWLANAAMKVGDYERVVILLDQLWRVDPGNRAAYADAMASLARDREGAALLLDRLGQSSPLALAAADKLLPAANDLDLLMKVGALAPQLQNRVIDRFVKEQGLEPAFVVWLSFLPASDVVEFSWPYDPSFIGSEAPAPFNWDVLSGAERIPEGGLLVRYSGRGSPTFARQSMLLGPGAYRLSSQMDGELSVSGGALEWQIQCLSDKSLIGQERISELTRTLSTQTLQFTVPTSGCPVQLLSLEGRPGPLASRARATVRHVAISALGN
jgi:tetratricopeptide (TPR) repeat protein